MFVYQYIYTKLIQKNVKDVFMYSGGAIMSLIDMFHPHNNYGNINPYINVNEFCLTSSAVSYSKSSLHNKIGVCITTSGPGLTNCTSGILDAFSDGVPLIVISGQVPIKAIGTNAFQEAPSTLITKSITKWNHLLLDPYDIDYVLDKAFDIATTGKNGPCHIDIPKCVLNFKLDMNKLVKKYKKEYINYNYNINNNIHKIINESKKPILYVGKGCINSSNILTKFASKGNIPITTTIHGLGSFDENNRLSLKMLGMHGSYTANMAIQNSDLIIAVGSRFDDRCTGNINNYAPNAKHIIHINIENNEFNKIIKNSINLHGDSNKILEKLYQYVKYNDRLEWFSQLNEWKQKHPFTFDKNKLLAQTIISNLNNVIKHKDFIIVTGVGNHQMYAAQFINYKPNSYLISSGSLGDMTSGLPYCIGSKIANPNKLVIGIIGDGSFNMAFNDLKTIMKYNLDIKLIILNNSSQDMVRCWEDLFYDGRYTATQEENPDYNKLSEAFKIKSIKLDKNCHLEEVLNYFISYPKSILLNCIVEPDFCFPLVKPGKALDDMTLEYTNEKFNKQDAPN